MSAARSVAAGYEAPLPLKVVTGVKVASVVDCCSLQSVSVVTSAVVAVVASAVVVRRGISVLKAGCR